MDCPEPREPWLQIAGGAALKETEVDKQLTARRAAQEGFIELSFPTIAGTLTPSVSLNHRKHTSGEGQ